MIVVDAAAWIRALVDRGPAGEAARTALGEDPDWAAPAHMPIEVLRTLRKYEFAKLLTRDHAQTFAEQIWTTEIRCTPPEPWLLAAVWQFRHTISPYDAAYVALAIDFSVPLITCDARLAKAAQEIGVRAIVPGT
ncbi:type II toxin-antitoxin system VapC family toxin [Nocardia macrotermitis]|uniref:type II toxin-antitoxin system VapC family toxin n=1 Tax=Nocardia macrotermitis TaxID=2585198 RepID=UPI001295BEEC|nr:type II toxin-antitoxin system VapC family toxin [Nocardia macrotermitis]